jgi:hypothetical protein
MLIDSTYCHLKKSLPELMDRTMYMQIENAKLPICSLENFIIFEN